MGLHVVQRYTGCLVKARGAGEAGHQSLDLCVVKQGAVGLVPDDAAFPIRVLNFGQHHGRHIAGQEGLFQDIADRFVDLVPWQGLVGGDVNRLADGVDVAHQANEAGREIFSPGDGPQAGAVARQDNGLFTQNP
ncbi:hypothetical protein SDC9_192400 [bioreactor metagenome]|uniref:Uncharacterized protein n=1 Tax=bioreactor metagenome TaxID=1076179 RepID=A0A645IBM3_9ZZZZ